MSQTPDRVHDFMTRCFPQCYVQPETGEIALPYVRCGAWWWLRVVVDDTRGRLSVVSHCPVFTPLARRGAMAEYLVRLGSRFLTGTFEFDPDGDGELRFWTAIDYGSTALDWELIDRLIGVHLHGMPRFLPGMLAVAYEGADPRSAMSIASVSTHVATGDVMFDDADSELAGLLNEAARRSRRGEPAASASPNDLVTSLAEARARLVACLRAVAAQRRA